jgi:YggT family protein
MGPLTEIANLLIHTAFFLYITAVLLRFLLQLAKADFYNPISQFLVKATKPVLQPLRRVIPGMFGLDVAALVLAILLQMLATALLLTINGAGLINPIYMLLWAIIGCVNLVVQIYFVAILVNIIVSWVAPGSYNPLVLLLHQLTEPVMAPFRKLLPPLGGLDLSPIIVFLLIKVIQILIKHLGAAVSLYPQLVIGM